MAPVKQDGTGKRVRWDLQLGQHMGEKGTKIPPKVVIKTRQIITKQAVKIAKRADEHEEFINKVTYSVGVACFGAFCFLLGSRPQDIPYLYCLFFITVAPLRWIYYRMKKWHYFLLDFCYYANFIFVVMLVFFPNNDKLFLICFSFAEGPLAWALIVWRCSLVFSSIDKIVSVLIHLLPGLVFFIIRWWDPSTFSHHSPEDTGPWPAWPLLENDRSLWLWLFVVPLFAYSLWQMLYFLVVNVLRRQRLLRDPEVMTSFRELSRKASRANNVWWRLSGILGDKNRIVMYAVLQALFTVATMSLAVPIFKSYRLHITFECFKVAASVWNGGNFFFDVMPRKMDAKKKRKFAPSENVNGVELPQASSTSIGNGDTKAVMSVESPVLVGPQMRFRGTPVINEQQISASLTNTSSPDFVDPTIHMGDNLVDVGQEIEANGERNIEEDPASSSVNMGDNLVDVGQEIEVNGERNIEEDPASSSVNTIWARRKASESSGDLG